MKNINHKYIRTINFKITFLLILLVFSGSIIYSQEVPKVNVTLKLKIIDGDLKNSQITITKKGIPYKVIDPDKGGTAVDLPLGFEYAFTFTKMGYNTKRILVDTHVPENRENGKFAKQVTEVELEKISGKLEDNYIQLIGKITYSMSKKDFDFSKDLSNKSDKNQKNEKVSTVPKSQLNSSPLIKSDPVSTVVKKSENKSETPSHQPIVKKKEKKIIQEDYRKITLITVNIDGKDYVYKKEEYSWGVHFYKNGKNITESTFINETE